MILDLELSLALNILNLERSAFLANEPLLKLFAKHLGLKWFIKRPNIQSLLDKNLKFLSHGS